MRYDWEKRELGGNVTPDSASARDRLLRTGSVGAATELSNDPRLKPFGYSFTTAF